MSTRRYETISDVVLALEEYKEVATSGLPDIEGIVDSLNEIESNYEDELRDKDIDYDALQNKCDDLEEKLCNNESHVEGYAASMLKNFTNYEPSLGDVLSLTEEITKILVEKFNISTGNL